MTGQGVVSEAETETSNETGATEDGAGHGRREWQPWDTGSKVVLVLAVVAILSLVAVFVVLSLPH